jgi:hypothetical protein
VYNRFLTYFDAIQSDDRVVCLGRIGAEPRKRLFICIHICLD